MATPPASDDTLITLNIQHQRAHASLLVSSDITLQELCQHHLPTLDSTRGLDPGRTLFKLVLKDPPRTLVSPGRFDGDALHELGLGVREAAYPVVLLASAVSEIQKDEAAAQLNLRREEARQAALKKPAKIRDTSSGYYAPTPEDRFRFDRTALLPGLPFQDRRQELLHRLATHPSVRKQMAKFKLAVGLLGELHPWTHPQLLGVNQNAGQSIHLRLLTDDLKSVRPFTMVRRVLSHELAHNVFGPHDNQFKELDSSIHKGMLAYDESVKTSSYRLGGELDAHYEPETADLAGHCSTSPSLSSQHPNTQVAQTVGAPGLDQARNLNPRLAAAEAAMKRAAPKK
ncbi:hypothetical protein PCASD_14370 [Puccinia coronata f. sp. avenae]|uniref:WLM domain-containing protein n=1 Tax=Puccinia coronata f. sp. avenae TaxID=200324 RepID=A0A2N5UCU5_9BASI|nr:hypothetical protein PCASD_14370 [Puccinia coronata f. sp. avenae]